MAGDFNNIIQGVLTQGTALQNQIHQTAQDITTGAYNTYTDSLSARIAAAKIQTSQDLTNTTNTDLLLNETPNDERYQSTNRHDHGKHRGWDKNDTHNEHRSWKKPDNDNSKRHGDSCDD